MTTPTPERPDDLDHAYARAHALAGGDRGPAASVRANVLAAAREIAAQAEAAPPLALVAAPVSDVGRGRAGAWNLASWRVRSGAALCVVILAALAVARLDANRHVDGDVTVAAADAPPVPIAPAALPAPAPAESLAPSPKAVAMPAAVARQHASARTAPTDAAPVAAKRAKAGEAVAAKAAPREPEGVLAQADVGPAPNARADASTVVAALEPPKLAFAPAPVERRANVLASPAPAPMAATPPAPALQRVEVTGGRVGFSATVASPALRGSAEAANRVSAAGLGSVGGVPSTPLHAAAGADDVDALRRLLADPATRVDIADAIGRTPLLVAVMAGHVRAARMLLAAGADPDHADSTGTTPRGAARAGASADVAALLAGRP